MMPLQPTTKSDDRLSPKRAVPANNGTQQTPHQKQQACQKAKAAQSFGFDAFGNLTKSGNVSFQVSYDTSKNQIGPGQGFTYDANGNTTHDNMHAYSWDAQGHAVSVDAIGLTYDALGRMVEQQNGSSYTQILYGPSGGKLALMNGQTVSKAFIPLPAGATAVYTSGPTLSYFRHPDWLGSSRFASTANRTMYYSGAYAPFGEAYAEAGPADRSFTGQNQDTVPGSTTGLYDFLFREYAQYGRWISPDPAGLGAVDPTNPQSWNRYAYVLNNPLSNVDPLGLYLNVIKPDADTVKWIGCRVFGFGCANLVRRCPWCTVFEWDDEKDCGPGKGPCGASFSQNQPSGLAPQPVAFKASPNYGAGLCGAVPIVQFRNFGGCTYTCEVIREDPLVNQANEFFAGVHFNGPQVNLACGRGTLCPLGVVIEVPNLAVAPFQNIKTNILSCIQ